MILRFTHKVHHKTASVPLGLLKQLPFSSHISVQLSSELPSPLSNALRKIHIMHNV